MRSAVAALLLVALPAAAADKGPPCEITIAHVKSGTVRVLPSDTPLAVVGGGYLDEESKVCLAKERARNIAKLAAFAEAPVITPPAFIVAVSLAFALGVGAALVAR